MHRMVSFVFKLIGISIMAMILFDTGIMLVDAFTTNDRIQVQALLMQQEIAKNNYLSEEAAAMFTGVESTDTQVGYGFAHINELSNVYVDIKYNYDDTLGGTDRLRDIKDYGDFHVLRIEAEINPWHYFFSGVVNNGAGIDRVDSVGTLTYIYYIPCLRYIK